MAPRQSIAHAWLLGAISHRRTDISPVAANPPEPAAPEGFLLSEAGSHEQNIPARAGTGDPDPGARACWRVPKSAGPVGGNEAMSRTLTERTLRSSQTCGATAPRQD